MVATRKVNYDFTINTRIKAGYEVHNLRVISSAERSSPKGQALNGH